MSVSQYCRKLCNGPAKLALGIDDEGFAISATVKEGSAKISTFDAEGFAEAANAGIAVVPKASRDSRIVADAKDTYGASKSGISGANLLLMATALRTGKVPALPVKDVLPTESGKVPA